MVRRQTRRLSGQSHITERRENEKKIENFLEIQSLEADLPRVALLTGDQPHAESVIEARKIAARGFRISDIGHTLYLRGSVIEYQEALKKGDETEGNECPPIHPYTMNRNPRSDSEMNGTTIDFRGLFHTPRLDGPPAVIEIGDERVEMRIETDNIGLLTYQKGAVFSVSGRRWSHRTSVSRPTGEYPEAGYTSSLFDQGESLNSALRYDPRDPEIYTLMTEAMNAVLPEGQRINAVLNEGKEFRQARGLMVLRGERKIPLLSLPKAAQTMAAMGRTASMTGLSLLTATSMPDIFPHTQREAVSRTLERICQRSDTRAVLATQSREWAAAYLAATANWPTDVTS